MPDAVIFDMDGVLIDSEHIYEKIHTAMANEIGITITPEESRRFSGVSSMAIWQYICTKYDIYQLPEQLAEEQEKRYFSMVSEMAEPQEGLLPLLEYFAQSGTPLAVASASRLHTTHSILNALKIKDYFAAIASYDDATRSKPWPDIFLKAASMLNTLPADCLVIEDAANGVAAARSAGMRCIGLASQQQKKQDLSSADWVASSLSDIQSLITNLCFRCG